MKRLARAKINLALHVTGQRADGYHFLDSLVTFAEFGDIISVEPADNFTLSIDGPFAAGLDTSTDNLVLKAAIGLAELDGAPKTGAAIHLTKNLPVASGMGGGSADAAATLLALMDQWDFSPDEKQLNNLALQLGADVPMCLSGETCIARGIGNELASVDLPAMQMVLVNPLKDVSTPSAFKALADKNNTPLEKIDHISDIDTCIEYLHRQRNDLLAPSLFLMPDIGDCLSVFEYSDAAFVSMSGSGATCFGIYTGTQSSTEQAAIKIQNDNPNWWVKAVTTII